MSEENKTKDGENRNDNQRSTMVELPAETYQALLDRIGELEDQASSTGVVRQTERSTLDELADEGRTTRTEHRREPGKNIDDMSNTEQTQFILDEINRQAGDRINKIEIGIETMRVLREIDKAEAKYDDFWLYENHVKELTMANPSMTIEDAYLLSKQKSPKKTEEGEEGEKTVRKTRTEKLLNLPGRSLGEKPGIVPSTTESSTPEKHTLKSAAVKAWEETVGKGKEGV